MEINADEIRQYLDDCNVGHTFDVDNCFEINEFFDGNVEQLTDLTKFIAWAIREYYDFVKCREEKIDTRIWMLEQNKKELEKRIEDLEYQVSDMEEILEGMGY